MIVLSSAHALNLDQSKILWFGKELNAECNEMEKGIGDTGSDCSFCTFFQLDCE